MVNIIFENLPMVYVDEMWTKSGKEDSLFYASLVGNKDVLKTIITSLKRKKTKAFLSGSRGGSYVFAKADYEVQTSKIPNSDLYHTIIKKKDEIVNDKSLNVVMFFKINTLDLLKYKYKDAITEEWLQDKSNIKYANISVYTALDYIVSTKKYYDQLCEKFYDILNKNSSIPIKKEWMEYLIDRMVYGHTYTNIEKERRTNTYSSEIVTSYLNHVGTNMTSCIPEYIERDTLVPLICLSDFSTIIDYITSGLQNKKIFIDENSKDSITFETDLRDIVDPNLESVSGLNDYLSTYSEDLSNKIQTKFKPRFNPNSDEFSNVLRYVVDYNNYYAKLEPYNAQKCAIQAVSNALDEKSCAYIIAEMGSGHGTGVF